MAISFVLEDRLSPMPGDHKNMNMEQLGTSRHTL